MSFIERGVLADPGLTRALPPGEQALTWVPAAQVTPGAVREQPLGIAPRPDRDDLLAVVTGGWTPRWAQGDWLERLFGGVAAWGMPGSLGAEMHTALAEASGAVVTERHLVAVASDGIDRIEDPARPGRQVASQRYRPVWSCARPDLLAARRRGRLAGRGRVELYFTDASMCAVVVGMVSTAGARRLLRALALPETPPPTTGT